MIMLVFLVPNVAYSLSLSDEAEVLSADPVMESTSDSLTQAECAQRYNSGSQSRSMVNDIKMRSCMDGFESQSKMTITGYKVVWRYGEVTGEKLTRYKPGKTIPVRVNFSPMN